jgi:hypothetical protein
MSEALNVRLRIAKAEYEKGKSLLLDLDSQRHNVARGLVKLEGMIEILLEQGAEDVAAQQAEMQQ